MASEPPYILACRIKLYKTKSFGQEVQQKVLLVCSNLCYLFNILNCLDLFIIISKCSLRNNSMVSFGQNQETVVRKTSNGEIFLDSNRRNRHGQFSHLSLVRLKPKPVLSQKVKPCVFPFKPVYNCMKTWKARLCNQVLLYWVL